MPAARCIRSDAARPHFRTAHHLIQFHWNRTRTAAFSTCGRLKVPTWAMTLFTVVAITIGVFEILRVTFLEMVLL